MVNRTDFDYYYYSVAGSVPIECGWIFSLDIRGSVANAAYFYHLGVAGSMPVECGCFFSIEMAFERRPKFRNFALKFLSAFSKFLFLNNLGTCDIVCWGPKTLRKQIIRRCEILVRIKTFYFLL